MLFFFLKVKKKRRNELILVWPGGVMQPHQGWGQFLRPLPLG